MRRTATTVLLVLVAGTLGAQQPVTGSGAGQGPAAKPGRPAPAFRLFAAGNQLDLDANRVRCGINDVGEQCVDVAGSPTIGGGFWPRGTADQYIFNGGLQVAAIIPGPRGSFLWAGDTVGAYFFDGRGDQFAGTALTPIYDSRNADDLAAWPSAAYVRDTALFAASLIGRPAASDQDSWVRYWDGDARTVRGRTHPMGVLVDQRTLAWNAPDAGRDVLFVITRLINVSARDRSRYAGLSAAGYTAQDIDSIARIGAAFHAALDTGSVHLPDSGFTWTDLYLAVTQDPDVISGGGGNYSTANLPSALAFAYHGAFYAPTWAYPVEVFAPPFASVPGLVGTKLLRAAAGPVRGASDVRMFTNYTGGAPFPERFGVQALWRVLSNRLVPADGVCNAPVSTPLCYLVQSPHDTRFTISSGPWPSVGPGQWATFVYAYAFAAPLAAAVADDGIGHALGSTSFDIKPGFPGTPAGFLSATSRVGQISLDTIRKIDRVAGWAGTGNSALGLDADGDGFLEGNEIPTVPRSLLAKAAAAQILADNKFLVAGPPAAPRFYLLPGDNRVTVVWEPSVTEAVGDPYFPVAADPLGALYDPNFRQLDVEGYRIWKGRTPTALELVAQFDYAGTVITDHTGQIFPAAPPSACAPELGVVSGCGVDFAHGATRDVGLAGDVIQVPPGGRALLSDGAVATFRTDTAVTGGASGLPPLRDTEVRFAYADEAVRSGTRYYYAVTAFDVNSINSGPSSSESERVVRSVQPRIAGANAAATAVVTGVYGGDGTLLDPEAPWPKIDSARGTFGGPIPPANRGSFAFFPGGVDLLPAGDYVARIDSIGPGLAAGYGVTPDLYVTFSRPGRSFQRVLPLPTPSYAIPSTDTTHFETSFPFASPDSAQARRYGIPAGADLSLPVSFAGMVWPLNHTPMGGALARGRWTWDPALNQATRFLRHSYWYDETATSQPPDPTIDPYGSAAHSGGQLTGVTTIYMPAAYRQASSGGAAARSVNVSTRAYSSNPFWYPADFVVRWGPGGSITVHDSTHRTDLPYKKSAQIGYGFISAANIVAAGIGSAELNDGNAGTTFDPAVVSYYSLYTIDRNCRDYWGIACADLAQTASLQPIDVTADGVSDGTGIALVINGEPFFLLMSSLPAAGTKWHLKAIGGGILDATCTPALPSGMGSMAYGSQPTDCSGYTWTPFAFRPAFAPGLQFRISVSRDVGVEATSGDLSRVHTVPDPVYFADLTSLGRTPSLRFVNLPDRAIIRIYSSSGILVTLLTHNDPTGGGEEAWDLRSRNGRWVASGVYFYHVTGPDDRTRIGRFTVVHERAP